MICFMQMPREMLITVIETCAHVVLIVLMLYIPFITNSRSLSPAPLVWHRNRKSFA